MAGKPGESLRNSCTAQFPDRTRSTYGVSIAVTKPSLQRVVTVSLAGNWPGGAVYLQLPSFRSAGVSDVQGGTYDATSNTVTVSPSTTRVVVTLDG